VSNTGNGIGSVIDGKVKPSCTNSGSCHILFQLWNYYRLWAEWIPLKFYWWPMWNAIGDL